MQKQTGFTLIELLVAILIIGILAAIALPQYRMAVEKARVMGYLPGLRTLRGALERYQLQTGELSCRLDVLDIEPPAGGVYIGGDIVYPDGSRYHIQGGGECESIYYYPAADTASRNLSIESYLDSKRFICWAYENDAFAQRFCRSLSADCSVSPIGRLSCSFD